MEAEQRADQEWLDRAEQCLDAMRARTDLVQEVAARAVRDEKTADARVAQAKLRQRRAALEGGSGPLCFGRIDEDSYRVGVKGDRWYVGRRHVEDEQGDPVVVDWRAPVSAAFYRATAVDPCGLARRRRFSIDGTQIEAVFDEDLTDPDSGAGAGLPDPLLAELDRSRTGQMRDIISTIASEQDEIIRSGLENLLIVQGGPGTGKTAVGLHRAAFLLFEHRDFFADRPVLVVGPNPVFLRYVSEVLPSLGETSVVQTTVNGLIAGKFRVRAIGEDDDVVALKGDPRLAAVIRNLMTSRIRPLPDGVQLRSGVTVIRFDHDEVASFQQRALDRSLPLNQARDVFRTVLFQEAWQRYLARRGADPGHQPAFVAAIRNDPTFKKDLDRMWPTFSPHVLVRELLGSPTKRKRAAGDLLTETEQRLLHRPSAKKAVDEAWTAADLPLLDEATHLATGIIASYGHVVVDEAQDHSPMALRMLGRRAVKRSMTVLGDLAQATAPAAVSSWSQAAHHLGAIENAVETELTVGYRVPAAILDVANRLLPMAAPAVTPARSIRPGGEAPRSIWFERADTAGTPIETAVAHALAALPASARSTAVIAVDDDLDRLERKLEAQGTALERVGSTGGGALPGAEALALVDPERAKGLEFDAVIVVDPARIGSDAPGLRRLYVAMTRAVQHLTLVCDVDGRDLPLELGQPVPG